MSARGSRAPSASARTRPVADWKATGVSFGVPPSRAINQRSPAAANSAPPAVPGSTNGRTTILRSASRSTASWTVDGSTPRSLASGPRSTTRFGVRRSARRIAASRSSPMGGTEAAFALVAGLAARVEAGFGLAVVTGARIAAPGDRIASRRSLKGAVPPHGSDDQDQPDLRQLAARYRSGVARDGNPGFQIAVA